MVLLEFVFLSVLIALIAGGRLAHLRHFPFRGGHLIILVALMQAYVVYTARPEIISGLTPSAAVLLASYALLVAVCALNVRLPGMYLIGAGLLLNVTVMAVNNGFMPVSPDSLRAAGFTRELSQAENWSRLPRSKDVLMPPSETRLAPLSDVLVLALPLPFDNRFTHSVMSVGDILVAAGIFLLAQAGLRSRLALLKLHPPDRPESQHAPTASPT